MRWRKRKGWLVLFGFFLASAVLLSPGTWRPATVFIGDLDGDAFQNVWNLWWMREALLERHIDPFFTDLRFAPFGTTLLLHTFTPLYGFFSIPIQLLANLTMAYNLMVVLSFAWAGLTMYWLARFLTGNEAAAVLAGMAFTFSAFHFAHGTGHLQEICIGFLPLFVLCVIRAMQGAGRLEAIGAGVWLSAMAWCTSWYQFLQALMLGAFVSLSMWRAAGMVRGLRRLGSLVLLGGGTFLALGGPLVFRMLGQLPSFVPRGHNPHTTSADFLSFFIPGTYSTYARWFDGVWGRFTITGAEGSTFIGYTALLLALVALWRHPAARFWGMVAVVFFVLALGPSLHILGRHTGVLLPYRWLHQCVPLISFMGIPARFALSVSFAIALLVGYGATWWLARLRSLQVRRLLVAVCGLLLAGEQLAWPYPHFRRPVSPFYEELAKEPGDFAIIDLGRHRDEMLYYQTVHGKRLVYGEISRVQQWQDEFLERTPILRQLVMEWAADEEGPVSIDQLARSIFTRYDIRYVIVHHNPETYFAREVARLERKKRYLSERLRLPLVYADQEIAVYRCQDANPAT